MMMMMMMMMMMITHHKALLYVKGISSFSSYRKDVRTIIIEKQRAMAMACIYQINAFD